MKPVEDVYPSKVDLPEDTGNREEALKAWREGCRVLMSGVHLEIGMAYLDAKGNLTDREIEVSKIFKSEDNKRYFSGFCRLRQANRSFREDRMVHLIDLETGEIFDPPSVFFDKYSLFDSPKLEELQIIVHILSYLARSDRKFLDAEKEFISKVIGRYCRGERRVLIESYAFNHKVKKQDFLNEVSKLVYMDDYSVWSLIKDAEEVIKIDGKISKKEQDLFDTLRTESNH